MSKTDREQKVREVRTYNQASETIHAGLGRISSRIRLSLSLRIAAHYCARLIRTSLVTMIIISLALAVGTEEYLPHDIYNIFINVTYAAIFFTVLVQGLSVGRVYRRLEAHKLARQMRAKQ